MIETCNTIFSTLYEINRHNLELKRIEELKSKKCCGNCNEFIEDAAFFVYGVCSLNGLTFGKNSICDEWKPKQE